MLRCTSAKDFTTIQGRVRSMTREGRVSDLSSVYLSAVVMVVIKSSGHRHRKHSMRMPNAAFGKSARRLPIWLEIVDLRFHARTFIVKHHARTDLPTHQHTIRVRVDAFHRVRRRVKRFADAE